MFDHLYPVDLQVACHRERQRQLLQAAERWRLERDQKRWSQPSQRRTMQCIAQALTWFGKQLISWSQRLQAHEQTLEIQGNKLG